MERILFHCFVVWRLASTGRRLGAQNQVDGKCLWLWPMLLDFWLMESPTLGLTYCNEFMPVLY
jgi:hypothetical protein